MCAAGKNEVFIIKKNLCAANGRFHINDRPVQIISGAIHYFRIVPEYWEDRLKKLKNCGFNTVETYVPWNIHEPQPEEYCFKGLCDLEKFIEIAGDLGLYVIVRPSPYICAEWEFGGLPYWLLREPNLRLRSSDPVFLKYVDRYYGKLLPRLEPLLWKNGGPVIAMQLENEYGSYGNDPDYLPALCGLLKKYGMDTFIFTADGTQDYMLTGGLTPDVFACANFGSKPEENFKKMDSVRPGEPHCCMEFWGGWFDHWGEEHHRRDPLEMSHTVGRMADAGASFNLYMFCGGTNFGFLNGSNYADLLQPTSTSYDSDAPLTENGDYTEKYRLLKEKLTVHSNAAPCPVEPVITHDYGTLKLTGYSRLFDNLETLSAPVYDCLPRSFEQLGVDYGFVLYRTTVRHPAEFNRLMPGKVHDRALYYADGRYLGLYDRSSEENDKIWFNRTESDVRLDILVENLGRINYGAHLRDEKGLLSGVVLGTQIQYGYTMYPLPLRDLSGLRFKDGFSFDGTPAFYRGVLTVEECRDTFIDMSGFGKGCVFVNGFNLGRYWEKGPYLDLYLPGPLLHKGDNEIIVFELEKAPSDSIPLRAERVMKKIPEECAKNA